MKFKTGKSRWGILVVAVVIVFVCLRTFRRAPVPGVRSGDENALPSAAVCKVTRQDLFKQVTIPAEFRPYVEAMLNAKVSGYVSKMNVDFGDAVKAGQLLATIEVPELQDQLDNAL